MAFNLKWDQTGERLYETGVDRGVVYPMVEGKYTDGEAWNGLTGVDEQPSGGEPTPLYANNRKYLELMSAEEFGMTIKAYTYPDSFAQCIGAKDITPGVRVRQQNRTPFGFTYRTLIGNDTENTAHGYIIHLVYNATAKPSERTNETINNDPAAADMSWECSTTPTDIPGFDPAAHIEINSTTLAKDKLDAIEKMLYGDGETNAKLPTPEELVALLNPAA